MALLYIIITVNFWQATLRPFPSSIFATKEGTIQYGYRKLGTHLGKLCHAKHSQSHIVKTHFHAIVHIYTFIMLILYDASWGGWMICHFLIIYVHFVFCQLNFIVLFPFRIKYYHILFISIVFWLGCDRSLGLLLFVPALLLSILTPLFLPTSSVCLISVLLFSCRIAILNGTSFYARRNSLSAEASSIKIKSN